MTLAQAIIGWFPLPVLLLLGGVLVWRKLYREFPLFFSCVCAGGADQIATLSALLAGHLDSHLYFYVYWISQLLVTVFSLLAVYELFVKRLFRTFYKVRVYRYIFGVAATLILVLSVLTLRRAIAQSTLVRIIHTLDLARVAILFFFVALMLFMGRRWRRYEFGIALGFSIDAALFLASFAVFTRHLPPGWPRNAFGYAPAVAYDLACMVWLVCFLGPKERETLKSDEPIDSAVMEEAKRSEDVLKTWMSGKPSSDK
jgi:hypothetical protein